MVTDIAKNAWKVIIILRRNDNTIKNHFYAKLRKAVRKLNKFIQGNFKK